MARRFRGARRSFRFSRPRFRRGGGRRGFSLFGMRGKMLWLAIIAAAYFFIPPVKNTINGVLSKFKN